MERGRRGGFAAASLWRRSLGGLDGDLFGLALPGILEEPDTAGVLHRWPVYAARVRAIRPLGRPRTGVPGSSCVNTWGHYTDSMAERTADRMAMILGAG